MSASPFHRDQIWHFLFTEGLPHLPASHPARITIRAGLLSAAASLTPSLIPLIVSPKARRQLRCREFLGRELGPRSFPFAVIVAIGGGACLERITKLMKKKLNGHSCKQVKFNDSNDLTEDKESTYVTILSTVLASLVAIHLLQGQKKPGIRGANIPLTFPASTSPKTTPSLDLTTILAVRAMDGVIQHTIREYLRRYPKNRAEGIAHAHTIQQVVEHVDVLLYSLAAWRYLNIYSLSLESMLTRDTCRIIWCFFYERFRLPRSYGSWIAALGMVEPELLVAIPVLGGEDWIYGQKSTKYPQLFDGLCARLGLPTTWGDPTIIPAFGGDTADKIWARLGVINRAGVGGLPCDLVHGWTHTSSCVLNAFARFRKSFFRCIFLYLPIHLIPRLLSNPMSVIVDPFPVLRGTLYSTTFLASYISFMWYGICFVRTFGLAKLFPNISHRFWDGPRGCIFLGVAPAGLAMYIENGRRRGELALYVLPRAVRTLLAERWLRSGKRSARWSERYVEPHLQCSYCQTDTEWFLRLVFVLSMVTIVTLFKQNPASIRGVTKKVMAFMYQGWPGLRRSKTLTIEETQTPPRSDPPSDGESRPRLALDTHMVDFLPLQDTYS